METEEKVLDATQERLRGVLPNMEKNLQELESKLAYTEQERERLRTAVEMQRGAVLLARELLRGDNVNGLQQTAIS